MFFGSFVLKTTPSGWASLIIVVLLMCSVQPLSLGIMGEYLRRSFLESKGRPSFIAAEVRRAPQHVPVPGTARPGTGTEAGL